MKRLNAPQHIIDELKQQVRIDILPMNWPAVIWFNEVGDLMRYRADGQCLGLDLQQVQSDAELAQRNINTELYKQLRVMSKAAARKLNKVD